MQTCTQMTQNESQGIAQEGLFVDDISVEISVEIEQKDGSPLRNALREYLKSYNDITESRERVTV